MNNCGGVSEASGATLTGDVNGSSRYMYVRYVVIYLVYEIVSCLPKVNDTLLID